MALQGGKAGLLVRVGCLGLMASILLMGCVTEESDAPDNVVQRANALDTCIARSQRTIATTTGPQISAGDLAPANSTLADAQEASEEVKKLTQQGKDPEALTLANKALSACDKIDAMVARARQDATTRKSRVQASAQVEIRIMQMAPCLDSTRQALHGSGASKKRPELGPAGEALEHAAQSLREARGLLIQGNTQEAMRHVDTADTNCRLALELIQQVGPPPPTMTSTRKAPRMRQARRRR